MTEVADVAAALGKAIPTTAPEAHCRWDVPHGPHAFTPDPNDEELDHTTAYRCLGNRRSDSTHLQLIQHLHDTHGNLAAYGLDADEARMQHRDEHHGPGGLRNHTDPPGLHQWGSEPANPAGTATPRRCGAWGGCDLPLGHNRGKPDIPQNHNGTQYTDLGYTADRMAMQVIYDTRRQGGFHFKLDPETIDNLRTATGSTVNALDHIDELIRWWGDLAIDDITTSAAKIREYGGAGAARDLIDIGQELARLANRDANDEEATELAIYFYIRNKLGRWYAAVCDGRRPSDDTLKDLAYYAMMARRNRAVGGWPVATQPPTTGEFTLTGEWRACTPELIAQHPAVCPNTPRRLTDRGHEHLLYRGWDDAIKNGVIRVNRSPQFACPTHRPDTRGGVTNPQTVCDTRGCPHGYRSDH